MGRRISPTQNWLNKQQVGGLEHENHRKTMGNHRKMLKRYLVGGLEQLCGPNSPPRGIAGLTNRGSNV